MFIKKKMLTTGKCNFIKKVSHVWVSQMLFQYLAPKQASLANHLGSQIIY